jgi:hypothetical protein
MTFIYEGIHKLSTIRGNDPKKRTFFTSFIDETKRLSDIASPFSKFVAEFGKFAKHMGTFKENFSFMNPEGIAAFENWTAAVEHLVVAAEKADVTAGGGMLNTVVEKTNDLLSTGFGIGDKGTDMGKDKKGEQVKKGAAGEKSEGDKKDKGQDMAQVVAAIKSMEKKLDALSVLKQLQFESGGKLKVSK